MNISVSKAAKDWGISRTKIYDRINNGVLSRNHDKSIDIAEMVRVFGEPKNKKNSKKTDKNKQKKQFSTTENALLKQQLEHAKELQQIAEKQLKEEKERSQRVEQEKSELLKTVNDLSQSIKLLEMQKLPEEQKKGFFAKFF